MQTWAFQPARLTLARALRGLSQKRLADDVGVNPASVSQWEAGATVPTPENLEHLAVVLGCLPDFFARPWRPVATGSPFFRSRRSTPQRERDKAEAYAVALAEVATALERWVELPSFASLGSRLSYDERAGLAGIEQAVQDLRAAWGIPHGPIPNVVRRLEARGAIVAAVGAFDKRLDAFSLRTRTRPIVVLCSDQGNAARRRFDAAHELGHLLLHDAPARANHGQEEQAHRFAAALL